MIDMLEKFRKELDNYNWRGRKVVLAVSGGADSMVMAHLFRALGENIIIAHFNYELRGEESEGDERLVKLWADENKVPFYSKRYELGKYLEVSGGNLQELARDLRYGWLEEVRKASDFDFIATAHHQQDAIETLLINFFKGCGLSGLHGISLQNGKVIRPMLRFEKNDILDFAKDNDIAWRMDSSNAKDDYVRNKVRNQVLPLLEDIFPMVQRSLAANIERFSQAEELYLQSVDRYRKKLLEQRNNDWVIPVRKLRHCSPLPSILYELLKPFGFQAAQLPHLLNLIDAVSGKMVSGPTHRIIKDRDFLIIAPIVSEQSTFITINGQADKDDIPFDGLILRKTVMQAIGEKDKSRIFSASSNEAYIDLEKLEFPLYLRPWKQGDYFYPLGMSNKKKKVSRFLIDEKVPLHKKEKIWVVESKKRIVWIIGMRLDERFKITERTEKIVHFALSPKYP